MKIEFGGPYRVTLSGMGDYVLYKVGGSGFAEIERMK